jgi:hypothetical protein
VLGAGTTFNPANEETPVSDQNQPGQESTKIPDWIPGWFIRAGEVLEEGEKPETREAVRWMGGTDFPIGFLRPGETVGPAKPPQRGITISYLDSRIGAGLSVPPNYWVLRDQKGSLALYSDFDLRRGWARQTDREWTPVALRQLGEEVEANRPKSEARNARQLYKDDLPPCSCTDPKSQIHDEQCVRGIEIRRRRDERMAAEADRAIEAIPDGWQGTHPAQGTRRRLIFDALLSQNVLSATEVQEFTDAIESALLRSTIDDEAMARGADALVVDIKRVDEGREADAQEAISAVGEALDRLDAPQASTFAGRIDRLFRELRDTIDLQRERISQMRFVEHAGRQLFTDDPRPAGNVPPGTRELHIVLAANYASDDPSEFFVELEDQDGRGLGGFESRQGDPGTRRVVIPYGRDDQWVQRVAMAAITAGQDVDRPFPADALDTLLEDYGIRPTFPRDWPSRDGQAAHEPERLEVPEEYKQAIVEGAAEVVNEAESERAWGQRMLEEREEARAGEGRFGEERDCAYALLRWLLPVTVAKRIDGMGRDED